MKEYSGFGNQVIRPVFFVEMYLDSGDFLANTSDKNITVDGKLYYGVGTLGKISEYKTTIGTEATALKFTLTNIPSDMTGYIVDENTRNKRVRVAVCLLNDSYDVLSNLMWWFTGTIDSLTIDVGQIVSIAASASSRLIRWALSVNSRYTDEDQQSKYSGDRGFKFMVSLQNTTLRWGN